MPLSALVFSRLPDRGWALSKPFSLLLVGWLVWFPLSIVTALPYSGVWIFLTFLVFAALNALLLRWKADLRSELSRLLRRYPVYIVASELVFTLAFLLLAWIRSFIPAVANTEKFMDEAFLASIWRAQHLPPPDPWLSGASINYYYFGHFLLASLAKVLNTQPGTAFNLGIAVIFGLVATAVFGAASNLTAIIRPDRHLYRSLPFGLFSLGMVLIFGNLDGAQIWWQQAVQLVKSDPAKFASPLDWWFNRSLWLTYDWWSPSRVITGTINEFPAFSFILSDLHAHVLALPFDTLVITLALCLLLSNGRGIAVFGQGARGLLSLVVMSIVIGSLYVINGWDLPTYLGLVLLALACQQWHVHGRRFSRQLLLDFAVPSLLLAGLSYLLYLPFYQDYVSPSQGIGLVPLTDRSPIGNEISIFGLPLFLMLSMLFFWGVRALAPLLQTGRSTSSGRWEPNTASPTAEARLLAGVVLGILFALLAGWTYLSRQATGWTLLWCLLLVGVCVVLALGRLLPEGDFSRSQRGELFMLLLFGTSAALVGVCEVVFLRDIFQDRMNTVFKLYYQAWLLLGLAAGPTLLLLTSAARRWLVLSMVPAAPVTPDFDSLDDPPEEPDGVALPGTPADKAHALPPQLRRLGRAGILVWIVILVMLVGAALIYPVLASSQITNNFTLASGTKATLDGTAFMATESATAPATCQAFAGTDRDDNQAIYWLNTHVQGSPVILEAPGCEWSYFSRVSAFTGLPTLIGWPGGHEGEWRINWLPKQGLGDILDERAAVVNDIYTSPNKGTVLALLRQYHVRYVYVGFIERNLYATANLDRFSAFLHLVYHRDGVSIYAVP